MTDCDWGETPLDWEMQEKMGDVDWESYKKHRNNAKEYFHAAVMALVVVPSLGAWLDYEGSKPFNKNQEAIACVAENPTAVVRSEGGTYEVADPETLEECFNKKIAHAAKAQKDTEDYINTKILGGTGFLVSLASVGLGEWNRRKRNELEDKHTAPMSVSPNA